MRFLGGNAGPIGPYEKIEMYESNFGNDFGKLILRLTVGGLMLFHGVHKEIGRAHV